MLKGLGYVISGISLFLLATVSWRAVDGDPVLTACLLAGVTGSVLGMVVRWVSHMRDHAGRASADQLDPAAATSRAAPTAMRVATRP